MKAKKTILLLLLITSTAFAQFGPGGPDTFGQKQEKTFIPGTDTDNQPKGNGKIAGILIDPTTSKPVEYVTIALLTTKTNKPVDGKMTEDKGRFSLNKLASGTIAKGSIINVIVINLPPEVRTLAEINVTGYGMAVDVPGRNTPTQIPISQSTKNSG